MPDTHDQQQAAAAPLATLQPITPRSLLEVHRLSDPQIHPDGVRVAFVVSDADFDESRFVNHVWMTEWPAPEETPAAGQPVEDDGTPPEDDPHTRQLTYSREGESSPRWSPDGRWLAFVSTREDTSTAVDEDEDDDPKEQIWLLPADGGEAKRLTSAREGVAGYEWSPDSGSIVYLAPEPRPRPSDSLRREDRSRRKIDPTVETEEWRRGQFWRIDIEERKPKLLHTGDQGTGEFTLAPDGRRLCYATNHTGDPNDYHKADLVLVELENGSAATVCTAPGGKYHLRWSPDGARIAFLSWLDPGISFSRESLYTIAADGEREGVPVLAAPDGLDYDVLRYEWSREDGSLYALVAARTGSRVIHIAVEARYLDLDPGVCRDDLGIDPEGGALAFVQESPDALPEIVVWSEQTGAVQLTRLNAEFAKQYRLPKQEVVRWESDGLEIEGVLTWPADFGTGKPLPLILQIHGGPKGRAQNRLSGYAMAPAWAAQGYVVLQPNYRGSEGYGNAFAIANRRDLGGGDYRDLMAGVDWLVGQGAVDSERLGVMGGSYGGYMTNWVIGHTSRFKAAISMFGIFHLQTDYSNSQLSRWDNDYLGAYYWEDPDIYRRLSPGSYLHAIRTPTLILHGDDDTNTFISNSREMYQAFRHSGVVTEFVHYPREGHGLAEPNHRLDELRRCMEWMERYLRAAARPPRFRTGDRVISENGTLEMRVTGAEVAVLLGRPEKAGTAERPETLVEVGFTAHSPERYTSASPTTLSLQDIVLECEAEDGTTIHNPSGVALSVPGGKVLVEGTDLRIAQEPDSETGLLAFAWSVVFRVPQTVRFGTVKAPGFPAVDIHWPSEESDTARARQPETGSA